MGFIVMMYVMSNIVFLFANIARMDNKKASFTRLTNGDIRIKDIFLIVIFLFAYLVFLLAVAIIKTTEIITEIIVQIARKQNRMKAILNKPLYRKRGKNGSV